MRVGVESLFSSIFQKKLEDFTTEALAVLLSFDACLATGFISCCLGAENFSINDVNIVTQQWVTGYRPDLLISGNRRGQPFSLLVENKAFSSPREIDGCDGGQVTQIGTYCAIQENRLHVLGGEHRVVLISPKLIEGFDSKSINRPVYTENITWRKVIRDLRLASGRCPHASKVLHVWYLSQLIRFLEVQNMAAFIGFTPQQLASVVSHEAFTQELTHLASAIVGHFKEKVMKIALVGNSETKGYEWPQQDVERHWGVLRWSDPGEQVWLFVGVATKNGDTNTMRFPKLIQADYQIPDATCFASLRVPEQVKADEILQSLGFANFSELEKQVRLDRDVAYQRNEKWLYFGYRRTLTSFLSSQDQQEDILEFLNDSFRRLTDPNCIPMKWAQLLLRAAQ